MAHFSPFLAPGSTHGLLILLWSLHYKTQYKSLRHPSSKTWNTLSMNMLWIYPRFNLLPVCIISILSSVHSFPLFAAKWSLLLHTCRPLHRMNAFVQHAHEYNIMLDLARASQQALLLFTQCQFALPVSPSAYQRHAAGSSVDHLASATAAPNMPEVCITVWMRCLSCLETHTKLNIAEINQC